MSSEDAKNNVFLELNENIPEFLNMKYKDNIYRISLQELEVNFDVDAAVEEAYEIGRTQNVVKDLWDYANTVTHPININAKLEYNQDILNVCLERLAEQLPDKVEEYSYKVDKDKLIINRGKSGVDLDKEKLKNIIIEKIYDRDYETEIEIPTIQALPKEIDLAQIHDCIYLEPKDAYYTENPLDVHEQIIGIDFDIQTAQNIIDSDKNQEQYKIALNLTNPNIFVKDLNIYNDELSEFSTNYANNPNRTTNLIIASSKITGTVLMPGEKFSFNDVVGERTVAEGYKNAAIFVNGQVEDGLAGGICQVSSTLYNAVVGANLKISERHNHSKLTSYLPGGKDATVVWGLYDFQFVNSREYPIKIEMTVQGGVITAKIFGIKSNDEYDIAIESEKVGTNGVYSIYNAYKVYKQNGVEIKRDFLSKDLYK